MQTGRHYEIDCQIQQGMHVGNLRHQMITRSPRLTRLTAGYCKTLVDATPIRSQHYSRAVKHHPLPRSDTVTPLETMVRPKGGNHRSGAKKGGEERKKEGKIEEKRGEKQKNSNKKKKKKKTNSTTSPLTLVIMQGLTASRGLTDCKPGRSSTWRHGQRDRYFGVQTTSPLLPLSYLAC